MQKFPILIFLLCTLSTKPQELFVSSESASIIPKNSISLKLSDHYFQYDRVYDRPANRVIGQLGIGLTKNFMLMLGATASNMHTYKFEYEALFIYGQYRFLSIDDIHKHFRLSAFINASHTQAPFHYDEIELRGDKSGIELGLIATKLINKIAFSGIVSHSQLYDSSRYNGTVYIPVRMYKAFNYSFSTGYLLFPKVYNNFRQLNVNVYVEVLAQQTLEIPKHYIDLAPAIQFIINSNLKINGGYRFEVFGNLQRMSKTSWVMSLERNFLNVFSHKLKNNIMD